MYFNLFKNGKENSHRNNVRQDIPRALNSRIGLSLSGKFVVLNVVFTRLIKEKFGIKNILLSSETGGSGLGL